LSPIFSIFKTACNPGCTLLSYLAVFPAQYALLPDYHTHTPLCQHAEGWPVDYARRARELGMTEMGFSDHNPMPETFDDWRMDIADLPRYLDLVAEARAAVPEVAIRLGMECDFLLGQERWIDDMAAMADFDYLIGSVHYLAPGWDLDNPKHLSRWRESGAVEEIWERYWVLYEAMVRSRLFDFHGHPDLPKKFNLRPAGDLRRFYEPTIQALVDTGGAIEINTAGLRKDCRELYPDATFLSMASQAGVPLVISSDAHAIHEVGMQFAEGLSAAREAGYTESLRFEKRRRHLQPLPPLPTAP
jgi:histidinol-phosphatase (PHP family)